MNTKIEILARAIIQEKGKILFCKKTGNNYYFLPGGHVEFRETLERTLIRELKEELDINIKKSSFVGISEHFFKKGKAIYHEINVVFDVLPEKLKTKNKEKHLDFFLLDKKQISEKKILPRIMKKAILKWLKNKKPFWILSG